jgi:predicted peroxiredoxin
MPQKKEEKILYICTHGGEDPDKAHIPFVMANAALAMDIKATVVLQGNGVYLAQKGYMDHIIPGGGFPPLKELMKSFMELGGKLLICVPCIKARNIAEADLIEGAQTTAAGALNIEAIESAAVFVY